MKQKQKQILFTISLVSLVISTGCLKTPEVEYVTNKEGQGTLISDNVIADNGIPIARQIEAPAHVTGSCEKVNEFTSIEIDADVLTPSGTSVPVYTVSLIRPDEEAVEAYTGILYETGEFYNRDYSITSHYMYWSVEEIYENIERLQRIIDTAEITNVAEPVTDEEGNIIEMDLEYKESLESSIDYFQQLLLTAEECPTYGSPVSYDFETENSQIAPRVRDGNNIIQSMDVTVDYNFEHASFTGRHNGREYNLSLYRDSLNSELRFQLMNRESLDNGYELCDIDLVTNHHGNYLPKPNTCSYSQEEAIDLCKDFLAELGIDNMEAQYATDIYLFRNTLMPDEEYLGKKGWKIYLYWGSGDMGDCYLPGNDGWMGEFMKGNIEPMIRYEQEDTFWYDEYGEVPVTRTWRNMAIFTVLDEGIIDAWIQNPVENKELLAEHVKLLNFDQVLEQGMAHLETLYGDSGTDQAYGRKNIKIRTIELNYARMQAPDTEGEFAMIPVWDFKTGINGESMVSINAIDGSVFDREQGY